MKKLRLELDALEVESFSTLADKKERGTVEGQEWTDQFKSNCCLNSASVPVACLCRSDNFEGTCETTCNQNQCFTCNGGWSCGACQTATCAEIC